VAFVLIDPTFFCPDYAPDVDPGELEEIGITDPDDMLVFAIVTVPPSAQKMTANLQGPLILNPRTHVGRQSISSNPRWGVRHTILDELAQVRKNAASKQNPPGTSTQNPPGTSTQNPPGTSVRGA